MNFINQNQEKESIDYEPFIAGALLKFESIDSIDFYMLVKDFQDKTNIEVRDFCHRCHSIFKYVQKKKNITSLLNGISLDSFIKEENCILREKLFHVAGDAVNDYFKDIDISSYYLKKEKELQKNKDRVLNLANVLLISENKEDYDELVKYGFQNIDYFRSSIRADQYFAKYPERLNKYHIVLWGYSSIRYCCYGGDVELEKKTTILRDTKNILEVSLHYDENELGVNLYDHKRRDLTVKETSYTTIFDRIIENTFINRTLDRVQIFGKIPKYFDYINPSRIPLPKMKSDLKILYLDPIMVNKYASAIARNLGLNVTFEADNNCVLGEYVKNHLGDYDIIIASSSYSSNLLNMDIECTEQCKDTGRNLTLLVSYQYNRIRQRNEDDIYDDQGSEIEIFYKYAGNFAPNTESHQTEFRVLRKPSEIIHKDEEDKEYYENEVASIMGILGSSINIYNDALLQNNKPAINDLDLKTAKELDQEYEIGEKQEIKRKNVALAPIRAFDEIRYDVSFYLDYKKKGLITQKPKDLKITESETEIKVENIYQGRVFCTITFSKDYPQENLRIFEIQTMSKKGTLSSPQTIGLYTKKYENLEGVPSRPDERQANALLSIQKKINIVLNPLNEEAWKKKWELDNQNRLVMKK